MMLKRRQLNYILCNLPDPSLVQAGRISPYLQIPVYEPNEFIQDALLPNYHESKIKHLKFRYSERDQDWILEDLVL